MLDSYLLIVKDKCIVEINSYTGLNPYKKKTPEKYLRIDIFLFHKRQLFENPYSTHFTI